jgi:Tfp pilus assembly protein PilN
VTATLTHPTSPGGHAVDERSLRIPDIGADLLPVEIIDTRRTRKVRRTVITAVAGFTVFLAAWYGLALFETSTATDNLTQAEDNVQALTRQQRDYTELVGLQAESKKVNQQLQSLLGDDLQWSRLLSSLQAVAPAGISVTGVTAALKVASVTPGTNTEMPTGASGTPIGTVTITGKGSSKTVIAAYVDALAKVPGVANALPGDISQQQAGLSFSVHMDITKAVLGGRYSTTPAGTVGK